MMQKSPSEHHRTTLSSYIFATKACIDNRKKLLNDNIFFRRPHNMANFGPVMADIGWRVWSTPANFNGFRVLASLLQRRRSPETNQTLHGVWPSPGVLHYIYIFWGLLPSDGILPGAKLTLRPSVAFSYIDSITARHWSTGRQPNCGVVQGMELRNFRRGCHLYSAGRPSRWASAHILALSRSLCGLGQKLRLE